MNRRHLLTATAAVGAAAAGLGGYLWRQHAQRLEQEAALQAEKAEQALDAATAGFWRLRFAQPAGGELATATLRGRPLLVNFWATWCPPCIKEMPDLDRFQREFASAGWQVLGLAVDQPGPVREFLARSPVGYPIGIAGFEGAELSRKLGNDRSALPFSLVFGADGRINRRKLGETSFDELASWARQG